MGVNDFAYLKRRMECRRNLAGNEGRILGRRFAAAPEIGNSFLRTIDINRAEHLPVHVDIAESDAKIRRFDLILDHAGL